MWLHSSHQLLNSIAYVGPKGSTAVLAPTTSPWFSTASGSQVWDYLCLWLSSEAEQRAAAALRDRKRPRKFDRAAFQPGCAAASSTTTGSVVGIKYQKR